MYYAAIGVLAIIIHVIMNHEFFRNREEKTETNKAFKDAPMEMIPADDYSDDNQTLFLYVKNIDR